MTDFADLARGVAELAGPAILAIDATYVGVRGHVSTRHEGSSPTPIAAAGPPLHDDARSLRDPPFLVACGPDAPVPAIDLSEERA